MKTSLQILAGVLTIAVSAPAAEAKLYERRAVLQCSSNACAGAWPIVPEGKALSIKTISCTASVAQATTSGGGFMTSANDASGFNQAFKFDFVESGTALATVQPVPMRVPGGKKPIAVVFFQGGNPSGGVCYLRGSIN